MKTRLALFLLLILQPLAASASSSDTVRVVVYDTVFVYDTVYVPAPLPSLTRPTPVVVTATQPQAYLITMDSVALAYFFAWLEKNHATLSPSVILQGEQNKSMMTMKKLTLAAVFALGWQSITFAQTEWGLRLQGNYLRTTDNVASVRNPHHLGAQAALDITLPLTDSVWYIRTGLEAGVDLFNAYGLNVTDDPVGNTYWNFLNYQWQVPWLRVSVPIEVVRKLGKWSPSAGVDLGIRGSLGRIEEGPTDIGEVNMDLLTFQQEFYAMGRIGVDYQLTPRMQVLVNYSLPLHQQTSYSVYKPVQDNDPLIPEETTVKRYLHRVGLGLRFQLNW
ncbi:MAG: hypothetical protein AAFQ98_03600 [Bacteroidota bacterium]